MKSLNELKGKYDTDKFGLGYVDTFYDKLFAPIREKVTSVLEIGIWRGGSLALWHEFFPNAKVYGIDPEISVIPEVLSGSNRLVLIKEDAYTQFVTDELAKLEPDGFDIIIDDGPHTLLSMEYFLTYYQALMKRDGIMVLEDIVDPEWTPGLVKLAKEHSSAAAYDMHVYDMRKKQTDPDLLRRWRSGLDVITIQNQIHY